MNRDAKPAVLHIALNPVTGPWSVMKQLAKAQSASGLYKAVAVGVITDKWWPTHVLRELQALGLPYYRTMTPKMFGTAQTLWQFIRRPGIEAWIRDLAVRTQTRKVVVHSHNAWLSGVYLPLRNVPDVEVAFVVTFHGVNVTLLHQPVRRRIHTWMARRLPRFGARLASVDAYNVPLARDVFGLDPDLFTIIHNGVPASDEVACPFLRGDKTFTLGHIGSISERKGWRIAARSVLRLAESGSDVRIVLAGNGPQEKELREMVSRFPATIQYLGFVSGANAKVMPRLDLLAMMSEHEGFPMSIVEAMAVGLPVAATKVGGISEALVHDETGFLIQRSEEALAGLVEHLIAHRDLLRRVSIRSKQAFLANFEISRAVQRYDALYNGRMPSCWRRAPS